MGSPWWARHTQSFAARQRDAYERSGALGWAFGAWKCDEATEQSMHPAVLAQRSLRAASQAGWLPDLAANLATSVHRKGARVLALFPGTTSFYPATVAKAPAGIAAAALVV